MRREFPHYFFIIFVPLSFTLVRHSMKKRALSAFIALCLTLTLSPFSFLAKAQEKKEILVVVGNISIDKEEFLYLLSKEKDGDGPTISLTRKEFEENFESFLNYSDALPKVKRKIEVGI